MKEKITSIKGIYRDTMIGADNRIIKDSGWVSNTILDGCRMLMTGFMKNDNSKGIQFLAVGQGQDSWDKNGAPSPDRVTTTDLENRYKKVINVSDLQARYLDGNDEPVKDPTDRLQITATLGPGYPEPVSKEAGTYPLREFGLFSTIGDGDVMINCIRHPVIHKEKTATLIRVIRLYF